MPDLLELRTEGPQSPDYTRQVANVAAEAIRVLNYATRDDIPGLHYPGDLYDLLGSLKTATMRLPQLFGQMTGFIDREAAAGTLAMDSPDYQLSPRLAEASFHLGAAHRLAEHLTRALELAQQAISHVRGVDA